jgi:hypothetical protein
MGVFIPLYTILVEKMPGSLKSYCSFFSHFFDSSELNKEKYTAARNKGVLHIWFFLVRYDLLFQESTSMEQIDISDLQSTHGTCTL